jgi:gliding motility-associated lipoprotein GldH
MGPLKIIFAKISELKTPFLLLTLVILSFLSCSPIDTFERNAAIPNHEWSSNFRPEVRVEIKDTVSIYNMYVVLRHADAYRYNNIWMNIYTQLPAGTTNKQRFDLRLATDDKGWLGTGMDDIFEHRILIAPVKFPQVGVYRFRFENIMRDDPLEYVMNVGIRIEKAR